MSGYDRVLIEPSGVFDMDLFFDALREAEESVKTVETPTASLPSVLPGVRMTKNGQRVLTVIGSGLNEKKIRTLINTK